MERTAAKSLEPVAGTIPEAARRFGLGIKMLRRRANQGAFPVYTADSSRPRVIFAEVERWLRSTQRPIGSAAQSVSDRVDDLVGRVGPSG